ncbi:uncharacterized protein Tco025E_10097, partial [Trypanosoma conorhini]
NFGNATDSGSSSASSSSSSSPSSSSRPGCLSWMERLPDICDTMRSCTARGARCSEFEQLAGGWVRQYLPPAQYEQVRRSYPGLGDPDARRGNLLQDVDPHLLRLSSSQKGESGEDTVSQEDSGRSGKGAGGWLALLLFSLLVGVLL